MIEEEKSGAGRSGTDANQPPIPSSASDILSTIHLQERCYDRNISSFQLDAAIKYGTRSEGERRRFNGTRSWKFNYKGITYVTDYHMKVGLTAYPDLCFGFDLEKVPISQDMKDAHDEAIKLSKDLHSWNSHTVVVVDQR